MAIPKVYLQRMGRLKKAAHAPAPAVEKEKPVVEKPVVEEPVVETPAVEEDAPAAPAAEMPDYAGMNYNDLRKLVSSDEEEGLEDKKKDTYVAFLENKWKEENA